MAQQNSILTGLAGAAIGYFLGSRNKTKTPEFIYVCKRGSNNNIAYPIYKINGSTKTVLSGRDFENIIETPSIAVTLVDDNFLNNYTTVGIVEENN